jgi:hypothetical protein
MPAFLQLDWTQFDVWALVTCHGLACVEKETLPGCLAWLDTHGYTIQSLECNSGFAGFLDQMNVLFRWEEQFGYSLSTERCSLDAVRDGFEISGELEGSVLILNDAQLLWNEEPDWLLGFLAAAQEYSLHQLALGRRFICVLCLPVGSSLVGQVLEQIPVPLHWSNMWRSFAGPN